VKWLFSAAQAPLALDASEVLNMRVQAVDQVVASLLSVELKPNLPAGKVTLAGPLPAEPAPATPQPTIA
jgi:hypothetical protein